MNEEINYSENDTLAQDENIDSLQQLLDNHPTTIDEVVVRPQLDLTYKKENMDYYLDPRKWLNGRNIARAINSGYIDTSQILGWEPSRMKYNPDFYGNRSAYRHAKQNARHNKRKLRKAMEYAGSDQKSASDRYFFKHQLPLAVGAATFGPIIVPPVAATAAYGLYTAPTWVPWVATNVGLPLLAGETVNEVTRKVSNGYYNSFGDFVYRSTPLEKWTNGTWMEEPTRFLTDMSNPAYWMPYGKIAQNMGPIIDSGISNTVGNVLGETARRSKSAKFRNWANNSDLVPAKLPYLYRAIGKPIDYINGTWDKIDGDASKVLNLNGVNRRNETVTNNIVNFTTDQKVINHAKPWDGWDMSDVIVFPRSFTRQMIPYMKSTAPMDTFIQTDIPITLPKSKLWKITGDTRPSHFKTISSSKLQDAFRYFDETLHTPGGFNKFEAWDPVENITKEQNAILWRRFGRPLKKDIQLLERESGLPSGIVSPEDFKTYVNDLISTPYMGPEFLMDHGYSVSRSTTAGRQNLPSDYKYIYNPNIEYLFREHPSIYNDYINMFRIMPTNSEKIQLPTFNNIKPVMGIELIDNSKD